MPIHINKETLLKYDIPGPRYTSYPTAPIWTDDVTENIYIEKLKQLRSSDKTLSLYIHIPFCQTLCSYCGCNVLIRKQEVKHGDEYLQYLFKEIDLITQYIGKNKKIKQFHWGGGTPTYFNEQQIERIFEKVRESFDIDFDGEIAIEIDPRTIDKKKMHRLRLLGFNRISMGVQDFNADVQKAVNRIQPYELVKEFNDLCHELKFNSVNFDLIYGLPHQTPMSFKETIDKVIALRPDRIALYSFAYVPWLKKHQNKMDKVALPTPDQKIDIFLNSRDALIDSGYQAIAMDHFALKKDELAKAFDKGSLYRNFMGYTVKPADEYIGLGLTSIGFLENTFVQNHKVLKDYYDSLDNAQLPIERGKVLNEDDVIRQWTINALICQFSVDKESFQEKFKLAFDKYFTQEQDHLKQCIEDNLIAVDGDMIRVTDLGKIFIRNVCMGFDYYLRQKGAHKRFSRTV
ncbi:Coproporphyrinogen III oxidase, oxygen-independent [hydrothermal vent metagenome]|uniref:Oxygen-independent coproporphyrinogen III oxidase n=1 Tax=hydrothermal vent metagenome TaxID=652676 RepID=A0A3B1D0R1_9ZZZZ